MCIRRRKWPCPKESVLLRKTHAMSYLCPPIPTTSLLRIIYVYIIGFFCLFQHKNVDFMSFQRVKYFIHKVRQKFLKYYSPCILTSKRSSGDWCSVYIQKMMMSFKTGLEFQWHLLFLEHISILQVKEPFSISGETSFIVFLPNDHLII